MSPYIDDHRSASPLEDMELAHVVPNHIAHAAGKSKRKSLFPLRSPRHETVTTEKPGIIFQFAAPEIVKDESSPLCHILHRPQAHLAALPVPSVVSPASSSNSTSSPPSSQQQREQATAMVTRSQSPGASLLMAAAAQQSSIQQPQQQQQQAMMMYYPMTSQQAPFYDQHAYSLLSLKNENNRSTPAGSAYMSAYYVPTMYQQQQQQQQQQQPYMYAQPQYNYAMTNSAQHQHQRPMQQHKQQKPKYHSHSDEEDDDENDDEDSYSESDEDSNTAVVPSDRHLASYHHYVPMTSASHAMSSSSSRPRDRERPRERIPKPPKVRTEPYEKPEPQGKQNSMGGKKRCFSCGTNKTPYWRDGWDGVALCNACGIRFVKYRTKCNKCLYIPRKDEKHLLNCVQCNAPMPLASNA